MRVLLFKEEKEARDLLAFYLESQFNAIVHNAESADEVISALPNGHTNVLLICDDGEKALKVFAHLRDCVPKLPVITIKRGSGDPLLKFPEILASVNGQNLLAELKPVLEDAIKTGKVSLPVDETEFCRIKTSLLIRVSPLKADIFVKLSDQKYLRVFNAGDTFDAKDLERFVIRKKIEYLYLKKSHVGEFAQRIGADLDQLLKSPQLTPDQAGKMAGSIHEAVQELGSSLGFTPEVQEVAKQGIRMAMKSMGTSPRLADLMRKLVQDKNKYITSHSLAVASIACGISAAFDWPSGTTFQKLTYAAFFHDIIFTNNDLCRIASLEELNQKKDRFTEEEIKQYRNHPILVSELMKRFHEVPSDVDVIILQHHERPDGSGFPKKIQATYISPLTCIFIIAHDLVDFLFAQESELTGERLDAFLAEYREKYAFGAFKRVLNVIDKARPIF